MLGNKPPPPEQSPASAGAGLSPDEARKRVSPSRLLHTSEKS